MGAAFNVTENHKISNLTESYGGDMLKMKKQQHCNRNINIDYTFNVKCDILQTWVGLYNHVEYLPITLNPRFLIDYLFW